MKDYSKKMKKDILRACGVGRKAASYLLDGAATDEVIQKIGVKALKNMENEKSAIEAEKRYREKYKIRRWFYMPMHFNGRFFW